MFRMIFAIIPDFFSLRGALLVGLKKKIPGIPRKFEVAGPEFGRRKFDPSGEELYSRGKTRGFLSCVASRPRVFLSFL